MDRARRGLNGPGAAEARNFQITSHEGGFVLGAGVHLHCQRLCSHSDGLGCWSKSRTRRLGTGIRTRRRHRGGAPGPPALTSNMAGLMTTTALPMVGALFDAMIRLPAHGGLASIPHSAVEIRHTKDRWNFLGDGKVTFRVPEEI